MSLIYIETKSIYFLSLKSSRDNNNLINNENEIITSRQVARGMILRKIVNRIRRMLMNQMILVKTMEF